MAPRAHRHPYDRSSRHPLRTHRGYTPARMAIAPTIGTRGRGGAGSGSCVHHAAAAVSSGAAKNVLVFRAFNERSGRRFGQPMGGVANPAANWHLPYGLDTPAKIYSLWYQHYMDKYGVTNADF